jgi:structural maintenance of chromosome 4
VHRLKITEKERDALESAKTEAESYLQKEQQLLRWQGTLHQIFLHKIEGNLAKIGVTKTELEAKLAHEKEKYVEYNKGLEEKETLYTTCTQEHGAIQAELTRTDQEFKEFERKDIKYREDLKFSKQKLKKVQEKMAKDETKLENAAKQEETLTAEVDCKM